MTSESLLDTIASLDSLAITGMIKNAGKTECLNFILKGLNQRKVFPAVTSIGVDGENIDIVKQTKKPEIRLFPGDFFVTTESFYKKRNIVSEIISLNHGRTSMGRLVTARALSTGKVILSGPSETKGIKRVIDRFNKEYIKPVIIDGALSRKSLGAPGVTQALLLATGAALSPSVEEVVKKTSFTCMLIDLPLAEEKICRLFSDIHTGVWYIDPGKESPVSLLSSALELKGQKHVIADSMAGIDEKIIYVAGAVTDSVIDTVSEIAGKDSLTLVVKDFSCLFISYMKFRLFLKLNRQIKVIRKPRLLALSVNPVSPEGYRLNPVSLCEKLNLATGYPVIDVVSGLIVNSTVKEQRNVSA